ncbi:MAG: hypothetical protein GXY44_14210 [Phycisphaerales bacterium]|nr:hypothetical protein [Phycisphaerales bacterium]
MLHITYDLGGELCRRYLCLHCADREDSVADKEKEKFNHAAIVTVTGLLTLVICAGADHFKFGLTGGFGFWQWIGVTLGIFCVMIGAFTRTLTIWVIGLFTVGLTLMAEWLRFGADPGFGYKQILGCLVGLAMIGAGLALIRRSTTIEPPSTPSNHHQV